MNRSKHVVRHWLARVGLVAAVSTLGGCAITEHLPFGGPEAAPAEAAGAKDYSYIIGPGDSLSVFVWRNPELNTTVTVRPDGKFSTSLVEDLEASGKTPTALAREIEKKLGEYIRDPLVTVTVGGFIGEYAEQVRVVGEAAKPQALPYRKNMTALDVMIEVGGLTDFAAGNRATLVRNASEGGERYRVRLEDLIKDGDIDANVAMQPGDVLIIPEAWF
ncbi:MAG: polysaccharide export protein [Gammaproteobacteria bacterium]|jgi:polysaccharide biosynthesis/export protein|nr:polysaccharide export protein [Gammaproteobacteria bacterium]